MGMEVSSWSGFFVPAHTSRDIIGKIHADTVTAITEPAMRARLEQSGVEVIGSTPDELASFLRTEMGKWGTIIKEANIKVP